jgi:hypothetical protein
MNHTKPITLKVQPIPNSDKPYKTKGADSWNPFKKEVIDRPPAKYQNESPEEVRDRILGYELGKIIKPKT